MENMREPIRSVEIGAQAEFRVNGRPFFPVMVWLQGPDQFRVNREIGVNTFVGDGRGAQGREFLDRVWEHNAYGVVHFREGGEDLLGHPALLGWLHGDEPDLPKEKGSPELRRTPQQVMEDYQKIRAVDRSRPVFLNFTIHFSRHFEFSRFKTDAERAIYSDFVKGADAVGFNIYPLYQRNRPDKLTWVADGVSDLREIAGPKRPLFAWIETNKGSRWIDPARQRDPTPEEERCQVWMALIRGVQAIGYFPHSWVPPPYTQFAVPPENREALRKINGQITGLTPVLLGPDPGVAVRAESDLPVEVMARRHGGSLYVFVLNVDMERRGGEVTLCCDAIPGGASVEVSEAPEGTRSLTSDRGAIRDAIEPLGVNIYRIPR
jgi:hypothetical protein